MNQNQAYNILGISPNSTEEEAKKAFRKLSIQYHPDKFSQASNQEQKQAEEKFKEINAAYQTIINPNSSGESNFSSSSIADIMDFINNNFDGFAGADFGFGKSSTHKQVIIQAKELDLTLEFKESILGCNKTIEYERRIKCKDCKGYGYKPSNKKCDVCLGNGRKVINSKQGNNFFTSTMPCNVCNGIGKKIKNCDECKSDGLF